MAENKKYYFLKLKEDFFDQREIVVLEGSKDGVLYVNILLKLYLKSLQHNGKLLLNEMTPLSAEMIALLTRHEIGTVERAMRAFMQLGLVEVLEDNTFYMPEIEEMTGKGSSDGERKARYRRQKAEGSTPFLIKDSQYDFLLFASDPYFCQYSWQQAYLPYGFEILLPFYISCRWKAASVL